MKLMKIGAINLKHPTLLLSCLAFILTLLVCTIILDLHTYSLVQNCQKLEAARYNRRAVSDVYLCLVETESAQRGYIITGNIMDASQYYDAVNRVHAAVEEMHKRKQITPDQARKLQELDQLVDIKLGEMASTIDAYQKKGPQAAMQIVRDQRGLRSMMQIKELKDWLRDSFAPSLRDVK